MEYLLFVDDNQSLLKVNRIYFESHGYKVYTAETEPQAIELMKEHVFDCVVLDILLPESDGYEICKAFKARTATPVIFLTSLTEKEFLYKGLSLGGDDFMTKPYELKELELRIIARIRQSKGILRKGELLEFPPLSIEAAGRRVMVNKKIILLTSNEFDILLFLAKHHGQVFSLDEIYREVWRMPDLESTHTVQVHISKMRKKLETACPEYKFIGTVWGKGYLFEHKKEETH